MHVPNCQPSGVHARIQQMDSLQELSALPPQVLHYFHILEIDNIDQLKDQNPLELYERLCRKTETQQDPAVIETFAEAIAQAQKSWSDLKMTFS